MLELRSLVKMRHDTRRIKQQKSARRYYATPATVVWIVNRPQERTSLV